MTEEDKKLADEIFEWLWPYFLQMKEPERLQHKDWNVPPTTGGLKATIFAMMDIYHYEKQKVNATIRGNKQTK